MDRRTGGFTLETEAKYTVPDVETFARLNDVEAFGSYVKTGTRLKTYHDRYVDTPDHSFYTQKLYARLREPTNGGSPLITLKRLGAPPENAIHSREEYQTEVSSLDINSWPDGEPKAIAREVAGEQILVDFITVDQNRTVSILTDAERKVAELSLDEITMQTATEPVRAYELEVELLPDGTLQDLRTIGEMLTGEYGLTPQPLSKFERAMMLSRPAESAMTEPEIAPVAAQTEGAGGEPGPAKKERAAQAAKPARNMGVLPTDSMHVAGRKILGAYFQDMLDNEEGSRKGKDPEALHDMRVATRRMRAVFQVLGPYLQEDKSSKVGRGLRSVTQALGAVRDLDVLLDNARRFCSQLSLDRQQDMEGLISEWADHRKKARKKMIGLLNSKEYDQFRNRMQQFLQQNEDSEISGEPPTAVEPTQVRHVAGSAIWERYEAVRAYETIMDAPTLEQLHSLRVKAKYFRYTLECFREALPATAAGLINDIVGVQDQLGEMHDAAVAAELIRSYQGKDTPKGKKAVQAELPAGLLNYMADREDAVRRLYAEFFSTWANVGSAEWRATLAGTVAQV